MGRVLSEKMQHSKGAIDEQNVAAAASFRRGPKPRYEIHGAEMSDSVPVVGFDVMLINALSSCLLCRSYQLG